MTDKLPVFYLAELALCCSLPFAFYTISTYFLDDNVFSLIKKDENIQHALIATLNHSAA